MQLPYAKRLAVVALAATTKRVDVVAVDCLAAADSGAACTAVAGHACVRSPVNFNVGGARISGAA